jgi:hypothetical protein
MDFVKPYDSFINPPVFVRPEYYWNPASKCLRIDEYYLFLEHNIILEKKDFNCGRLNELFGLDLIPDTLSEWMHLGTDVASGILGAIPGFQGASILLDVLHGLAYFAEASNKDNENERYGLYLGGVITLSMAFLPPVFKNIAGAIAKKTGITMVGKFIWWLTKNAAKFTKGLVSGKFIGDFISGIFRLIPSLGKKVAGVVGKFEATSGFKLLNKVPAIKTMTEFLKNKFSVVLGETTQMMAKDLNIYKMSLRKQLPETLATSYRNLDSSVKAMIDEKTFVEMAIKKVEKRYISKITQQTLAQRGGGKLLMLGKDLLSPQKIAQFSSKVLEKNAVTIEKEVAAEIAKSPWKKAIAEPLKKEAMEYAIKNKVGAIAAKAIPYEKLITPAMKRLPIDVLKKVIPGSILKTFIKGGAVAGVKTTVKAVADAGNKESESESESDSTTDTNTSQTTNLEYDSDSDSESNSNNTANNDDVNVNLIKKGKILTQKFENIKEEAGVVDRFETIGHVELQFRVPDRSRNDDDDSGHIILSENEVFNAVNISNTLTDYTDADNLLSDLKIMGKKGEDKGNLRDRELKKWQKSQTLSSPYIQSEVCRYEYYFVIRERTKISLYKKNHEQDLNLPEIFKVTRHVYAHEVNNSMFMIVKRISKDNDE